MEIGQPLARIAIWVCHATLFVGGVLDVALRRDLGRAMLLLSLCMHVFRLGGSLALPILATTATAGVVSPAVLVLVTNTTTSRVTLKRERITRGQLAAELASNSKLQGAWVKMVVPPDRGKMFFHPIVDEQTAVDQNKALAQFLKKTLRQTNYEILPYKTRPVRAFTQALQSMIEVELTLGSCLVTSAYYKSPLDGGNAQALMLLGRVANNGQKAAIVRLSNALKNRPPFKETMLTSFPKPDEMKVIAPSKKIAKQMFKSGRQSYRNKDYTRAQHAFARSVLEDPSSLMYRYWNVVASIANNDARRAYKRLKPVVHMRQTNSEQFAGDYEQVMRSLERVQGPVRIRLLKLEKQAMIEGSTDN